MSDEFGCTCIPEIGTHPCPYKEEMHDDSMSLCACCLTCRIGCRDDLNYKWRTAVRGYKATKQEVA